MCQFILCLQTTMDLNLLVTLLFHGILQKGRVNPNILSTSSLQMEILSTISDRQSCRPNILKKKIPFID